MKAGKVNKAFPYAIVLLIFCAILVKIKKDYIDVNDNNHWMYNSLLYSLTMKLVMEKPVPAGFSKQESKTTMLIYVLGGNQESLISRFRKASSLYHQGLSKKILILSRPGITEFNQELGRNLTNDEWSIRELEKLNVRKEDIEPAFVKKRIFGTLSEAMDLSDIVRKKGCRRLILVTSNYHTRRVFTTFSKYASNNSLEIFIYGSNDTTGLGDLFIEYFKLLMYNNFAIPAYTESAH
jgi:uncharacterized SAM-binding protein YcdF (DUF218 family)